MRIEEEAARQGKLLQDPALGIWRDRETMADVEAYLRKIRAPRYHRDGTRNDGCALVATCWSAPEPVE